MPFGNQNETIILNKIKNKKSNQDFIKLNIGVECQMYL